MPMFQQPYKSLNKRPSPYDYALPPPPPVPAYMTGGPQSTMAPSFVSNGAPQEPDWVGKAHAQGATTPEEVLAYKPDPVMSGAQYFAMSNLYRRNPIAAIETGLAAKSYKDSQAKESSSTSTPTVTTEGSPDAHVDTQPNITDAPHQTATYEGQSALLYNFDDVKGVWGGGNYQTTLPPKVTVPAGYWGIRMPDGSIQMYQGTTYIGVGKAG